MYTTLTQSQGTPGQLKEIGSFLAGFLPRLNRAPGVLAVYHFDRPDKGNDYTIVIWESRDAAKAYRQGALATEAMAFEQSHNLPATRESYPLALGLSDPI